jgi:hypothetical protein
VKWYVISAVIVAIMVALLQLIGIYLAVQKTPVAKGIPLGQALRQSIAANGSAGRRWAEHPWQMTLINIAFWLVGSAVLGLRLAFYAR